MPAPKHEGKKFHIVYTKSWNLVHFSRY